MVKFCPNCSSVLAENEPYCENCGFDPDYDFGSWDYGSSCQPTGRRVRFEPAMRSENNFVNHMVWIFFIIAFAALAYSLFAQFNMSFSFGNLLMLAPALIILIAVLSILSAKSEPKPKRDAVENAKEIQHRRLGKKSYYKRCPNCEMLVNKDIYVCKYCGHGLGKVRK